MISRNDGPIRFARQLRKVRIEASLPFELPRSILTIALPAVSFGISIQTKAASRVRIREARSWRLHHPAKRLSVADSNSEGDS